MDCSVEIIAIVMTGVIGLLGIYIFRLRQENGRLKEEYKVKIEIKQYWRTLHKTGQLRVE